MTALNNEAKEAPVTTYLRRADVRALLGLKNDASVTDWFTRGKIPRPHLIIGNKPVWIESRFHSELLEMSGVKRAK
jgi:hypothetical protein